MLEVRPVGGQGANRDRGQVEDFGSRGCLVLPVIGVVQAETKGSNRRPSRSVILFHVDGLCVGEVGEKPGRASPEVNARDHGTSAKVLLGWLRLAFQRLDMTL